MPSRLLAPVFVAALSLLAVTAHAGGESRVEVRAEGPIGTWIEERDADDTWRFVCNLLCVASMDRAVAHRVVDGTVHRSVWVPRYDAHPVVRYERADLPRAVTLLGAVTASVGATVALVGIASIGLGAFTLNWYSDEPTTTSQYTITGQKLLVGGGITLLVGAALLLTGVIAHDKTKSPAAALATPLGFRF